MHVAVAGVVAAVATCMGVMSFISCVIRARQGNIGLSNSSELCAIGWFILAAIVLK